MGTICADRLQIYDWQAARSGAVEQGEKAPGGDIEQVGQRKRHFVRSKMLQKLNCCYGVNQRIRAEWARTMTATRRRPRASWSREGRCR